MSTGERDERARWTVKVPLMFQLLNERSHLSQYSTACYQEYKDILKDEFLLNAKRLTKCAFIFNFQMNPVEIKEVQFQRQISLHHIKPCSQN